MATVTDAAANLDEFAHPLEWEELADRLHEAFRTAANLAPPKTATDCRHHPLGAVDPEAPEGWSRCLLCNDRRRRTLRGAPPAPAPARRRGDLGYPVPPPPYDHSQLRDRLRRASDVLYQLDLASPDEHFMVMADVMHEAFCIARELSRPRNTSGCEKHPGGPKEPDGACLLCRTQTFRASTRPPTLPRKKYLGGKWRES